MLCWDPLCTRFALHRAAELVVARAPPDTAPMLQEVFNLDQGPVTLKFPSNLTQDSYEELEAALQLFLRRAQRRAQWNDPAYRARRQAEIARRANRSDDDEAAN